jgi:hypothetical protein
MDTSVFVLLLKSAALHLQVRGIPARLFSGGRKRSVAFCSRTKVTLRGKRLPLSQQMGTKRVHPFQGRDHEVDAPAVADGLEGQGVDAADIPELLTACVYLITEAGTCGGVGASRLAEVLGPLGFEGVHAGLLADVLDWVRGGSELDGDGNPEEAVDEDADYGDENEPEHLLGDRLRRFAVTGQARPSPAPASLPSHARPPPEPGTATSKRASCG